MQGLQAFEKLELASSTIPDHSFQFIIINIIFDDININNIMRSKTSHIDETIAKRQQRQIEVDR